MSHKPDDLDHDLQSLFRDSSRRLDVEPFLSSTLKRIERRRSYRVLGGLLLRVCAFVAIAVLSPALIRGSVWLSNSLKELFDFGGNVLSTPRGTLLAVLLVLSVLLVNARRSLQRSYTPADPDRTNINHSNAAFNQD